MRGFRTSRGVRSCASTLVLLVLVLSCRSPHNIAPDAVTRATEGYNSREGDPVVLTDGRYPGNDPQSVAVRWPVKGNVTFALPKPVHLKLLRLYVGPDAGAYQAVVYQGAYYENGQTITDEAEMIAEVQETGFQTNTWVTLPFPSGTVTDYIELAIDQSATLYEIEIIAE